MKRTHTLSAAACIAACFIVFLFAGCASAPEEISADLSPAEYFQKGQEAANAGRYDQAEGYYRMFLQNYPDDRARGVEAEYEIAFLAYKRGETEEAARLFEELLDKYRSEEAAAYPQWPRVLAAKVLDSIEEE